MKIEQILIFVFLLFSLEIGCKSKENEITNANENKPVENDTNESTNELNIKQKIEIRAAEKEIVKQWPKHAANIDNYHRYYKIDMDYIYGLYLNKGTEKIILLKIDETFPQILDGGCNVINIKISKHNMITKYVFCNEDA